MIHVLTVRISQACCFICVCVCACMHTQERKEAHTRDLCLQHIRSQAACAREQGKSERSLKGSRGSQVSNVDIALGMPQLSPAACPEAARIPGHLASLPPSSHLRPAARWHRAHNQHVVKETNDPILGALVESPPPEFLRV